MGETYVQWRVWKQVAKSAVKRWFFGRPQPTRAEIAAARTRVENGTAGCLDRGNPGRDYCLSRGFCCHRGCMACPWGYKRR